MEEHVSFAFRLFKGNARDYEYYDRVTQVLDIHRRRWRHALGFPCFTGMGKQLQPAGRLYTQTPLKKKSFRWVAVPYHFWGNREKGEMRVWMQAM